MRIVSVDSEWERRVMEFVDSSAADRWNQRAASLLPPGRMLPVAQDGWAYEQRSDGKWLARPMTPEALEAMMPGAHLVGERQRAVGCVYDLAALVGERLKLSPRTVPILARKRLRPGPTG